MRPRSLAQVLLLGVLGCTSARAGYLPHSHPHHHHHPHLTLVRHAPPAVPPYSTQINIFRWLAAFPPPVLHRALLLTQGLHHHPAIAHHPSPVLHHPSPVLHQPPPVLHHPPPVLNQPPPVHHLPPPVLHQHPAVFHQTPLGNPAVAPPWPHPPPVIHQTPAVVHHPAPSLPSPAPQPAFHGITFNSSPGLSLFPETGQLPLSPGILPTSSFLPVPARGFFSPLPPSLRPLTPNFLQTPGVASFDPTTLFANGYNPGPTITTFPPGFFTPGTSFDLDNGANPARTPTSSPPQMFPTPERPAPLPNNPAGLTYQDLPLRQFRPAFAPFRQYLPAANGITRATAGNLAL